jgi:O-antigen/teichoic acid export membrane protein
MKQKVLGLARNFQAALPEGTAAVGAGLAVSALTSYVFVIVALNALDGPAKASFSAFWAVIFVAGPGFFLPLEQEVGRALAHRRAQGLGGGPLVTKAARLGGIITVVLVIATIATAGLLSDELYHGDMLFVAAVAIGIVGFYVLHLARGVLAGEGRFRAYGELLAGEGTIRLVGGLGLAAFGVDRAGGYAMVLALSPFVAAAFALRKQRQLLTPGPDAPYSELSANLGWLLLGSVLTQTLAYSPLLAVNILSDSYGEDGKLLAAGFASAFFVARVPVLAFQAVQGTLLPKLAGLSGSGRHDEFRRGLNRLLTMVVGIAVLGTILAFLFGPFVGKILFKDFTLDAVGLGLLAAGSGGFIIALTLAQALMALGGYRMMVASWASGLAVCGVLIATLHGLELRVELSFLIGVLVAAAFMFVSARYQLRKVGDIGIEALVDQIEHEPIEI